MLFETLLAIVIFELVVIGAESSTEAIITAENGLVKDNPHLFENDHDPLVVLHRRAIPDGDKHHIVTLTAARRSDLMENPIDYSTTHIRGDGYRQWRPTLTTTK